MPTAQVGRNPSTLTIWLRLWRARQGPSRGEHCFGWASGGFVFGGIAFAVGFVSAILTVADLWLNHRLVCLTGVKCAVGLVNDNPHHGGLGNFDNDEFFNTVLMPHRKEDQTGPPGSTSPEQDAHPKNYIHQDGLMGEE